MLAEHLRSCYIGDMRRTTSQPKILEAYDSAGKVDVFTFKNGKRVATYGNLDMVQAYTYILERLDLGFEVMVFPREVITKPGIDGAHSEQAYYQALKNSLKLEAA